MSATGAGSTWRHCGAAQSRSPTAAAADPAAPAYAGWRRATRACGGQCLPRAAKVAYAPTAEEGWEHAHRLWPNAGLPGEMSQILPTPEHFEQASELVTPEMTKQSVTAGNDPEQHLRQVQEYADAGFDELYVANMGPHHQQMIEFYGREVLPQLS